MNKTNKKIIALAIITVFLISLMPAVLAEPKSRSFRFRQGESSPERTEEQRETSPEEPGQPERLAEKLEKKKEQLEQKRELFKKRITLTEERYQKAKERYTLAKEKYLETREKVTKLRREVKECVNGESCELKKKQFRSQTKVHLIHLADVILKTLDKLTERIEDSEIDNIEKKKLLTELKQQITEVEKAKAALEKLKDKEEVTQKEINNAVQTIKQAWTKTRPKIKIGSGKLIDAKLGNIIIKIEKLEKKFQKVRGRLERKGYDISSLDNYLEELNNKLTTARENWEKSKEKFQEAKDADNPQPLLREAHQLQKEARKQIKEVREELRDIVQEIKRLEKKETPFIEETETEETETEETETEETETEETETEETETEEEETEPESPEENN